MVDPSIYLMVYLPNVQMGPNRSERAQTGPNGSERLKKMKKVRNNSQNFANENAKFRESGE